MFNFLLDLGLSGNHVEAVATLTHSEPKLSLHCPQRWGLPFLLLQ